MSVKHGSDNMAKRDSIVVKDIKNVSVGVQKYKLYLDVRFLQWWLLRVWLAVV